MPGIWPLTPAMSSPSMRADVVVTGLAHVVVVERPAEQRGVELAAPPPGRASPAPPSSAFPGRSARTWPSCAPSDVVGRPRVLPTPGRRRQATGRGVNDARTAPGRFVGWISPSSPSSFGAIFLVELPDKTFVAALVLATRYKPLGGVGRRRSRVPGPDPHRVHRRQGRHLSPPHAWSRSWPA